MVHLSIRSLLPRFLTAFSQNPAFGPGQLRSFTPIFNQKAHEVRNIWFSQINEAQADVIKVDIPNYMGRVTLDIIGLAGQYIIATKPLLLADTVYTGFDYKFDSLHSKGDELGIAFSSLASGGNAPMARWTITPHLLALAPILTKLVRVLYFPFTNLS
jgi:hypothetical protein